MSCNGCRVLRKGCSDACVLRPSIEWIDGAQPQANATVFVAKFFGRAGLVASLAAVPLHHRPALFRSLLYEACGRTINPVSGGIGLMWTGNWDLCQEAADAVLRGESLRALSAIPAAFTDRDMDGLYGSAGVAASSSSPENSSSAPPSRKRRNTNGGLAFNAAQGFKFRRNFAEIRRKISFSLLTGKKNFGIFRKISFENSKFKKFRPKVIEIRRNLPKFRNEISFPLNTGICNENEMVNPDAAAAVPACQNPPAGLLQSCELDLCLTPASPMAGSGRRGCGGASDEYSATTTCEDLQAAGDVEARAPALLNLFN